MFNATFNNISVISWRKLEYSEKTGYRPAASRYYNKDRHTMSALHYQYCSNSIILYRMGVYGFFILFNYLHFCSYRAMGHDGAYHIVNACSSLPWLIFCKLNRWLVMMIRVFVYFRKSCFTFVVQELSDILRTHQAHVLPSCVFYLSLFRWEGFVHL